MVLLCCKKVAFPQCSYLDPTKAFQAGKGKGGIKPTEQWCGLHRRKGADICPSTSTAATEAALRFERSPKAHFISSFTCLFTGYSLQALYVLGTGIGTGVLGNATLFLPASCCAEANRTAQDLSLKGSLASTQGLSQGQISQPGSWR